MSTHSSTPHSPQTTVLRCFEQVLPQLIRDKLDYKSVQPSSQTTKKAEPPLILLCKQNTNVRREADRYLQQVTTKTSILANQLLGTESTQITLNNETDLVFASTLYIIKPLLDVLQLRDGNTFTVTSEEKAKAETLASNETASRVDLVIRSNSKDKKAILVIEYKRREQIRYKDFEKALLPIDAPVDEVKKKLQEVKRSATRTLLQQNALSYTKQVATYAKHNDCKHIALLNWDHLLLFEFNKRQGGMASGFTAGETAELVWVSEEQTEGRHVQPGYIRKALLGFAFNAFDEHNRSQAQG